MSLRDDAFDVSGQALADLPYAAYFPRVRVTARLTVVADLPVEWAATPVPAREFGGSYAPKPIRKGKQVRINTCVEVPPVYAVHTVRGRQAIPSSVEVGAISVGHRMRVVDPLPGVIAEEDELLALVAAEL